MGTKRIIDPAIVREVLDQMAKGERRLPSGLPAWLLRDIRMHCWGKDELREAFAKARKTMAVRHAFEHAAVVVNKTP